MKALIQAILALALVLLLPVAVVSLWSGWPSDDVDVSGDEVTPLVSVSERVVTAEDSLRKALAWVVATQAEDGGWHSRIYGQLRGGAGTTALMLYALSHVDPELLRSEPGVADSAARAIAFLHQGLHKKGFIADLDGWPDFPTYATALTLTALDRLDVAMPQWPTIPEEDRQRMVDYLVDSQLVEPRGWQPGEYLYGGWDHVGGPASGGSYHRSAGSDLSVTTYAIEALATRDSPASLAALKKAAMFVRGCQNVSAEGEAALGKDDAGFFFTPIPDDLSNKAGWHDDARRRPASYGSTTADGARALSLLAAAIGGHTGQGDESGHRDESWASRSQGALSWLLEHNQIEVVPGFTAEAAQTGWESGLRFYYYASLCQTLRSVDVTSGDAGQLAKATQRREAVIALLLRQQQADGSWYNDNPRMREDDALVATPFALIALSQARP